MCRYIVDLGIKLRPLTNVSSINFIGDLVNWKADLYDRKLGIPGLRWCSLKGRFGPEAFLDLQGHNGVLDRISAS